MRTSKKYVPEILTTLFIAVLFLPVEITSADTPPGEELIDTLAENAKLTADTFMQQSFNLRMQYEYSGRFLTSNNKENLNKLAGSVSDKLQKIAENQETLKQQIEDYNGDDWDKRYGSTGLWRKLSADIYTTKLSRLEIDYYLAFASEQPQQNRLLHSILNETDALARSSRQLGPNLTRGKTLALLAQTEPSYKDAAIKEFEAFAVYSDIYRLTAAAIEKMKLLHYADVNELNILVERIRSNWNDRYLELILSLMFLQRQYDPVGFEETARSWPQTEDLLGSLILSDICSLVEQHQSIEQTTVFEAELAAQAAWKDETKDYNALLDYFLETDKFQTPLIYYVSAVKLAGSAPAKAVDYLIEAGKLQKAKKSDRLDIEPAEIAAQAAQLAYNLFVQDANACPVALGAFENYSKMAGEKIDEELEYLYTIVLKDCSREQESKALLNKIANRPTGKRRNRAGLDLIAQTVRRGNLSKKQYDKLLERLEYLIADRTSQNKNSSQIRFEAIRIYCQLLLELGDEISARKALNILAEHEIIHDPNLNILKSTALRRLGQLDQSAQCLLEAIKPGCCDYAGETMGLLLEITEEIDRYEKDLSFMENCKKLAQFCCDCSDGQMKQRAGLLLIETSVFDAAETKKELSGFEEMLGNMAKDGLSNDIDFTRCSARLLAEQGKFHAAAVLWAKIGQMRKNEAGSPSRRSWKWWRARFYELACLAKSPQAEKQQLLHTIETLENSFPDIPPFWAEKLKLLKQQCDRRPTDAGLPR